MTTTLVVGSTGKTGRRVAERLRRRGVEVRAGSRSGAPPFDWEEPATWPDAVRGVDAAYVSFYPDLAVPGAPETVGAFARTAVEGGVRQLVLLSGRGEDGAVLAEQAVQDVAREGGAGCTVVRASWFAQNFSEGYLLEPVLDGVLALPAGDVPEPFVDADDIADVAVAALTEPGHAAAVYEVTGPRALTFTDVAEEISAASGRDLRFEPVPIEEYAAALTAFDVPDDVVWLLTYLFTEVLDGRNASPADGVRRALGREARDVRDYARATAATGIWGGDAERRVS